MNYLPEKENNENKVKYTKIGVVALAIVAVFCVCVGFSSGNGENLEQKNKTLEAQVAEQEKTIKEQGKQIRELEENKKEIEVAEDVTVVSTEMCKFIVPAKRFIVEDYTYVHTDEYTKEWEVWGIFKDVERITYTGKMGLGIDFDKIGYEIDQDEDKDGNPKNSGKIVIHLPEPKIQSHNIVDNTFRADSVNNSWLVSSDAEEYEQFKMKMMKEEENKVLQNENVWRITKDNTEKTISSFLEISEVLKDYRVYYKWDGDTFIAPETPKVNEVNHSVTGSAAAIKA